MKKESPPAPFSLVLPMMAVGLLAGCASTKSVHYAADPTLDPNAYASFHVVEGELGHGGADKAIETAINRVMTARGFTAQANREADLYVTYKVLTVDRGSAPAQAQIANPGAGDVGNLPAAEPPASQVDKLVLIQLQDSKSLQIIWVGWSRDQVDEANLAAQASRAANEILRRIPRRS